MTDRLVANDTTATHSHPKHKAATQLQAAACVVGTQAQSSRGPNSGRLAPLANVLPVVFLERVSHDEEKNQEQEHPCTYAIAL